MTEILIKIICTSPFILILGSLIALLGDKINYKPLFIAGAIIAVISAVITFFLVITSIAFTIYSIWTM